MHGLCASKTQHLTGQAASEIAVLCIYKNKEVLGDPGKAQSVLSAWEASRQ